jgi:hypothetical protein
MDLPRHIFPIQRMTPEIACAGAQQSNGIGTAMAGVFHPLPRCTTGAKRFKLACIGHAEEASQQTRLRSPEGAPNPYALTDRPVPA